MEYRDKIWIFECDDYFPVPRPLRDPGVGTPFQFTFVEQELGLVFGEIFLEEAADLGVLVP